MSENKIVTVDGIQVKVENEKNLLEVIRKAKIDLPTFCYHSELSVYGACRLCIVDVEGRGVMGSCSTLPEGNMNIRTQTPELKKIRKMAIELLLANGEHHCPTCARSNNCKLQDIAAKLGVDEIRFKAPMKKHEIDNSSKGIVRDQNKCVLCGDCVRACHEIQSIGAIDFVGRGPTTVVSPAYFKPLAHVDCVDCGQCVRVCPTGALVVKDEVDKVFELIHNPQKKVVVQIAPAVRVALGEMFGKKPGEDMTGQIVTALRMLGFDKVYDTAFSADLTVLEESAEFLKRKEKGENLPLFTSCCPAWVKFAEQYFPALLKNVSTCRSPQQMFGSFAKEYLPKELKIEEKDLVVVSIMPCTAKKGEADRKEFRRNGEKDVEIVLTTQELANMIKKSGIMFEELEPTHFDMPLGIKTGAGIIFGNTGGVSEAVLRHVVTALGDGKIAQPIVEELRSQKGRRELSVSLGNNKLSLCIVHGLKNAKAVAEEVVAGKAKYDIIEVMSCPGGCIGGAGQPVTFSDQTRAQRAKGLYNIDSKMELRVSSENTHLCQLKEKIITDDHKAHELLHTHYHSKKRINDGEIDLVQSSKEEKLKVKVCVGTSCYLRGATDVLHNLLKRAEKDDWKNNVDISATFCFEKCDKGPTVCIGDKVCHKADVNTLITDISKDLEAKKVKK